MEGGKRKEQEEVEKLTPVKSASLLSYGKFNGAGKVGRWVEGWRWVFGMLRGLGVGVKDRR